MGIRSRSRGGDLSQKKKKGGENYDIPLREGKNAKPRSVRGRKKKRGTLEEHIPKKKPLFF